MSLEASFNDLIRSDDLIASIVGTKVRPLAVAQGETPPFLTYQIRAEKSFDTLADGPADYRPVDIEIGIYSRDYDEVATLSEMLRTLLDEAGGEHLGIEYAPIMFEEETDVEQVAPEGEETPTYVRVQTYYALYKQVSS